MVLLTALALVFGGCCSNLFFLEKLIRVRSEIGDVLTFAQFLAISIEGLIYFALVKRRLPAPKRWFIPSALYFGVNVLNNKVWAFNVSVQMHSIFRSCNALIIMLVGLATGKRYSKHQIAAVGIITSAVILAAVGKPGEGSLLGLAVLSCASVLNAIQSLYMERIECSGREMLFMLHFCSLPLFIFMKNSILSQWSGIDDYGSLAGNCFTQWVCAMGVNQLMSTGALTTSVVLTLRKFVSTMLSAYLFDAFSPTLFACALILLAGTIYYAMAPREASRRKVKQD